MGIDMEEPEAGKGRGMRLGVMLSAALAVLLLLGAGIILLDPFGWHVIARLQGEYDPVLDAAPADSSLYIGVNLLSPDVSRVDNVWTTISAAAAGDIDQFAELRRQIEEQLIQEMGISMESDITPWVGQFIGLSIVSVNWDQTGQPADVEWLLSAETRDKETSDQFLSEIAAFLREERSVEVDISDYRGAALADADGIVFGRSEALVMMGSSVDALQQAIDAQHGKSLSDTLGYQQAAARLPKGRVVTGYVNGTDLNQWLSDVPTPLPHIAPENLPTAAIRGIGISLSLPENDRIQIDAVTAFDPEKLSAGQKRLMQLTAESAAAASLLPEETLLFITGKGIDVSWELIRRAMIAEIGRDDFEESMRMFAREFSIDFDRQLFPLLDGDFAVGLLPSSQGVLASGGLGAVLAVGTSDEPALASTIAAFSEDIGRPQGGLGLVTVSELPAGGTIYEFETPLIPELQFAYGVGQHYLLVGTSKAALSSLRFDGTASLADSEPYQAMWAAFPEGMIPAFFVDINGLRKMLDESDLAAEAASEPVFTALAPISRIAGASFAADDTAQIAALIFLESR